MNENDNERSLTIMLTLVDSKGNSKLLSTMELVKPPLEIAEKLRRGDQITWSHLFSMMSCDCLKFAREEAEANLSEQSTEKPLRNSMVTLSLVQLLAISSHFVTLEKRLASLKQKLTPMDESEPAITSQALRQADSQVVLMTLELEEISRILRRDFGEYLLPIRE